ncbi:MAG TPA: hypothetical protein VGW40_05265 [Allosphingosinicella sp.]|nr:hypothetical protein [Allosphingosinicella sp.]
MSDRHDVLTFRIFTLAYGGIATSVGLWAFAVGRSPFALGFGLLTLAFAEAGLWFHRRRRRQPAPSDDGHRPVA